VAFEDIAGILRSFVRALSGRPTELATAAQHYTDTEVLHLPARIAQYPDRDTNFRLYKAMAAHQWAQSWFGTWSVDPQATLSEFPDRARALRLLHHLETRRLDACIRRALPGLATEMQQFRAANPHDSSLWAQATRQLEQHTATIDDALSWLHRVYPEDREPPAAEYQGQLLPALTVPVVNNRITHQQQELQRRLAELLTAPPGNDPGEAPAGTPRAGFTATELADDTAGTRFSLSRDGAAVEPDTELQALLASIAQDLGGIPDAYLDVDPGATPVQAAGNDTDAHPPGPSDTDSFRYDEWDQSRLRYRRAWCCLREQAVAAGTGSFAREAIDRYRGLLHHLRNTFEQLQQENKRLKREPYGDDVDIDAMVEAYADTRSGLEGSDRLFIKSSRVARNVAVMFMVDMSASTAGWTNRVEREALVLLCEALEALDDRYAIYGFSGHTHKDCRAYRIKEFNEPYNDAVRARIGAIQAQDYTRMGAAIRHLSGKLAKVEARTKLLMVLSDGRPDDQDGYRGTYGIEDTRRALAEARHAGIHPFCVTIDTDAGDYLPHMFGKVNFTVIDRIDKLPYRIGDIYRHLTT
jgi:nitric oxide reductase NorD protein